MRTDARKAAVIIARDELATEHQGLHALVQKLRPAREAPVDSAGLLDELHTSLASHFARETYPGGLYERMGACTVEHLEDLRLLVHEHFVIISSTRALKDGAHAAAGPDPAFDEDLSELIDRLAAHELREHTLVVKLSR
jgi:hypothetical protein